MRGQYFPWSEYHWSPSQFLLHALIVPLNTDEPPVRININKSQHTEMVSHGDGLNKYFACSSLVLYGIRIVGFHAGPIEGAHMP